MQKRDNEVLGEVLRYQDSRGEVAAKVSDILMHVITHRAYHRGPIAADLRAQGYAVRMTDYIVAAFAENWSEAFLCNFDGHASDAGRC